MLKNADWKCRACGTVLENKLYDTNDPDVLAVPEACSCGAEDFERLTVYAHGEHISWKRWQHQ